MDAVFLFLNKCVFKLSKYVASHHIMQRIDILIKKEPHLKVVNELPHELVDEPLLRRLSVGEDPGSDASGGVLVVGETQLLQGLALGWAVDLLQELQHLGLSTQSPLYFVHALEEDSSMPKNHVGGIVEQHLGRDSLGQLVTLCGSVRHLLPPGEVGGRGALDVKLEAALRGLDQPGRPGLQVDLTVLLQPLDGLENTGEVAHHGAKVVLEVSVLQDELLVGLLELL